MELTKDVSVDLALVGVGGVRGGGVGVRRGVAGVSIAGRDLPQLQRPAHQHTVPNSAPTPNTAKASGQERCFWLTQLGTLNTQTSIIRRGRRGAGRNDAPVAGGVRTG